MNKIIIIVLAIITFFSCQEEKLEAYSGDNYIYFTKSNTDSITFSFAYDATLTKTTVNIPVEIISGIRDFDREYKVIFLADESTAVEGQHFTALIGEQTIKAGNIVDTLRLEVMKTDDIDDSVVEAVFQIVDSKDFRAGFPSHSKARVQITNKLVQPQWWDNWHVSSGLGDYSNKKYRLFIQVTGEFDLDYKNREDLDYSEMRTLLLQFKRWLEANPQTEEDGSDMEVKVKG